MIFISFVEEIIMNPAYHDFIAGRIEVTHPEDSFHSEEIRFLTRKIRTFNRFRAKWDMKGVDKETLKNIEDTVERKFYDKINP